MCVLCVYVSAYAVCVCMYDMIVYYLVVCGVVALVCVFFHYIYTDYQCGECIDYMQVYKQAITHLMHTQAKLHYTVNL